MFNIDCKLIGFVWSVCFVDGNDERDVDFEIGEGEGNGANMGNLFIE